MKRDTAHATTGNSASCTFYMPVRTPTFASISLTLTKALLTHPALRMGQRILPKLISGGKEMLYVISSLSICMSLFMIFLWSPQLTLNLRNCAPSGRLENITILLWHWPYSIPYSLVGNVCLESYSIPNCNLVDNRGVYSHADLVVFHNHELQNRHQKLPLHLPRPVSQRWVWLSLESPQNVGNLSQFAGIFNLTMTYSPYTDVTVPYGKFVHKEETRERWSGNFILPRNKTHLACWVVSNYKKQHRRSLVYEQLSKTIPVQVYGHANKRPLGMSQLLPTISHCYFYLAFENTESPHYITEKFWRNAFQAGTVPVVLGPPRHDYEAVAPSNSFIHVDDFTSVEALGRFLKELAQDEKRYKSYFEWRQDKRVKLYTDWRERLCNICLVYDSLPFNKIHKDLGKWA